ncbi:putative trichothecene 3-O-acetyltransferase [Xylariaceae sp. FL1651]|nr:putative trichothecene 3-O-acetyltransferase [Xylariaceae sp. FL1651]
MGMTNATPELDLTLDIFGQTLVTIFTQIAFCFPISDDRRVGDILSILNKGAERVATHFPWVAGQVVCEGTGEGNTGVFKIKKLDATPRILVKDFRSDPSAPSWDILQQSGFPMNILDENLVAPRKSNSGTPNETIAEVFQLQATILKGGLILTFLGQHQSMDGIGQDQVIQLFAKACRAENFTEKELRIGNLAPENVVRLLGQSWAPGPELEYNIIEHEMSQPSPGNSRNKMTVGKGKELWAHFNFSASALRTLKLHATRTLPPHSGYVSTDDTLTAFIMQSIARARLPRLSPATETLSARAVDLRRYLDIPPTHPGFVQSMAYHKSTMQQVIDGPLGAIAAGLRAAIDPKTSKLAYHGRSFATLISRTPDKTTTSLLAGFDMSKDVMINSWANQSSYQLDFGLGLGKPQAVRRPRFDGFQGLVYFMPRTLDGDIGVAMCLNADDMEMLRADNEFSNYAIHTG